MHLAGECYRSQDETHSAYVPIHQTNAALPTSSLELKTSYLKQLDVSGIAPADRPEPRWMVDPNE